MAILDAPKINEKYEQIQKAEAKSWLIEDPVIFRDKKLRETARYPMMARQMGLNFIDTSNMVVLDVGAGPFGGVSSTIPSKLTWRVDPLTPQYSTIADTSTYIAQKAEDASYINADLVIITNALDHLESPKKFLTKIKNEMKPGAYFAQFHAINNAITHPHEAHEHNINVEFLHSIIDTDLETVWELKYPEVRYGWVHYNGKVGQPAFCGLYRKVTGYK